MITIIVPTLNDEAALARMMPPLVQELVHGVVTDMIVYDSGSTDGTRNVCDVAGCLCINAKERCVSELIDRARGRWMLFLPPGAVLAPGWHAHVADHIDRMDGRAGPATFKLASDPNSPWWRRFMGIGAKRHALLPRGFLMSHQQATTLVLQGAHSLADLVEGRSARRLRAQLHAPVRLPKTNRA